jgi:ribosomal protein S18 acetylase RimI-like enzyme
MVIRTARLEDVEALAALAEETFRDAFAKDNDPADMDAYCASAFSVDAQRSLLGDPAIATLLVEDDAGALVGYAQLRDGTAPEITGSAPIELWRFYVVRTHHGSGIARALMDAVVAAAVGRNRDTLWLGVWERNHRARAFYAKHGFVDVGAHAFELGNDVQTDRLLARTIV